MEDQKRPAYFNIDLIYLYYNVAGAGSIILGQLELTDLYSLALVNKPFRAMVVDFGRWRKDLPLTMMTAPSTMVTLPPRNLPCPNLFIGKNIISLWYHSQGQVNGKKVKLQGHIYCLSGETITQHYVNVLEDHIFPNNSTPTESMFPLLRGCFAAKGTKIVLCISDSIFNEDNDHVLVFLYDFFENTLLQKKNIFAKCYSSIFKLNSEMAVFLERSDMDETTQTMKVQVNISHSHEDFLQMKYLCQIPCVHGDLIECVVFDDSFAFKVWSRETDKKYWYKVCLSKDLTSVASYVTFTEGHSYIQWLKSGHPYCEFYNPMQVCFHKNGTNRWVSLDGSCIHWNNCKSSDGNMALLYQRQWELFTLAVFNDLGDLLYERNFETRYGRSSSLSFIGNFLFMASGNQLYIFDTKRKFAAKTKVFGGTVQMDQNLNIQGNRLIVSAIDVHNSFTASFKCWTLN